MDNPQQTHFNLEAGSAASASFAFWLLLLHWFNFPPKVLTLSWDRGSCQGWSSSEPPHYPWLPNLQCLLLASSSGEHWLKSLFNSLWVWFGFYSSPQEWIPVSHRFRSSCAEHIEAWWSSQPTPKQQNIHVPLRTGMLHIVQGQDRTQSKPLDCQSCWVKQLLSTVGYLIQSQHGFI